MLSDLAVVVIAGSASHFVESVSVIFAAIGGIPPVQIAVIFGAHVSSAALTLVAHADVLDFPGLLAPVFLSQFCHGTALFGRHVFHPFGQFLHCAAPHVSADVRLAPEQFAKVEELVRAETVILHRSSPIVMIEIGRASCRERV